MTVADWREYKCIILTGENTGYEGMIRALFVAWFELSLSDACLFSEKHSLI